MTDLHLNGKPIVQTMCKSPTIITTKPCNSQLQLQLGSADCQLQLSSADCLIELHFNDKVSQPSNPLQGN